MSEIILILVIALMTCITISVLSLRYVFKKTQVIDKKQLDRSDYIQMDKRK